MQYKVKFYDSGVNIVKRGVCQPFETYQTNDYAAARKDCINVTLDNPSFTAILVNNTTGNYVYFYDGSEV